MTTEELHQLIRDGFDNVNKRFDKVDASFEEIRTDIKNLIEEISVLKGKEQGRSEAWTSLWKWGGWAVALAALALSLLNRFGG